MIAALEAAGDDAATVGMELIVPLIEQIRAITGHRRHPRHGVWATTR
jgi:hypothetical protein